MITDQDPIFKYFYGDPKYNRTTEFYSLIRQTACPENRVLNLGAGPATGKATCSLKGEVAEVVGANIDPVVLSNTELDHAVVIEDGRLPFPDECFDLAYSDYVLEHVEKPDEFLAEVHRVLKPGGSYFFRTPNNYHYVALIARATPHWFHDLVANRVRGLSEDAHEPWPTFFRLNTRKTIRKRAKGADFKNVELQMVEGHPSYLVFHTLPFLIGATYERIVNSTEALAGIRANIFGQLIK